MIKFQSRVKKETIILFVDNIVLPCYDDKLLPSPIE